MKLFKRKKRIEDMALLHEGEIVSPPVDYKYTLIKHLDDGSAIVKKEGE